MPFVRAGDVSLAYEVAGQGPPVLFIQGVGVAGSGWTPQLEALAPEFQTLAFDNRGLGRSVPCPGAVTIESMADDVRVLMDACGWESAHLVGHSMGGVIAQQVALETPGRVRSLSLLCTFPRGKDAARLTPWVIWMTLRTRIGPREWRRRAFLEMLVPRALLRDADTGALAARLGSMIGRDLAVQPPILLKQVRALSRHDASSRLKSLAGIPTMVISADEDPIAPPRYGEALASAIPGATYRCLPHAAHAVILHDPPAINDPLRAFLKSVETARGTAR